MASGDLPAGTQIRYSRQYRRCNKPDCAGCRAGGPGHGPYWYASWRAEGRRHTRYLGKQPPPSVDQAAPPVVPTPSAGGDRALQVRTLGAFSVWSGTMAVPATAWIRRKVAALFKSLLGAPGFRLHREALAELLWPEATPAAGAKQLRQTVFRLRRSLGAGAAGAAYLRWEGDLLVLVPAPGASPGVDWLDVAAYEVAARRALSSTSPAASRAALALYGGEYLPDDRNEEWAVARREELRQLHLAVLRHLAALREGQGALGEVTRCMRAVLALDPCDEPAARALMRVQLAAGRAAEAVRTYHRVVESLRRDLDLAPDSETEAQYHVVLAARQAAAKRYFNVPTPLTSFLGREQELATLAHVLTGGAAPGAAPACRLLTVTGAGGCGKTRLAIELGHELRTQYPEGLWLVELAALPPMREADPELIARQTSAVLGLQPDAGRTALATFTASLQGRQALFVLDNCEHLIAGCAAFVAAVLDACLGVRILTTSREALGVLGETVFRLPSLAVPVRPQQGDLAVQEVGRYAATRLLVERARLVRPDFALTLDNCRAVAEICFQLDGIPLAIELAAARLAQLSASDLAARLHDRFQLLSSGNRSALPRHQTLRAVIAWSYGLLSTAEQAMLRALSVFAGGWTLEAAEELWSDRLSTDTGVLEVLARLATKSLVEMAETGEAASRYRLLETLRHYAAQQLREQGEEDGARTRHLHWCLTLAEQAAPGLAGPDQQLWLDRLEAEHDNLRAALAWCVREGGDVHAGLRLAGLLLRFWAGRGHWHEGRRWLSTVLSQAGGTPAARLYALSGLGHLAINQGDHALARAVYEESLALGRALQDDGAVANALNGLGNVARFQGDLARAAALYQASLAIYRPYADTSNIGRGLLNLASVAQEQADYARAVALNEDAPVQWQTLGDRQMIGYTLYNQAVCLRLAGECRRAASLLGTVLPLFEALGDHGGSFGAHNELGRIACEQGEYQKAVAHLCVSTRGYRDLGDRASLIDVLQNWALLVARQGNPAEAARLLGAVDAAQHAIGHPLPPGARVVFMADVALVRQLLGAEEGFAANWAAGQAATLDDSIAELHALYAAGQATKQPHASDAPPLRSTCAV